MLVGVWFWSLLAIVLEGGDVDPAFTRSLLTSCREVLTEVGCELTEQGEFRARLSTDAALREVRFELDHRGQPVRTRVLELDAAAPVQERGRAAGLVLAAQVRALQHTEPPHTPLAVSARLAVRPSFRLDFAASLASALDRGPPRAGLVARGSWLAGRVPLGATASLRGAYRFDEPRLSWLGASAGLVARLPLGAGSLALEGRVELVGQHTRVRAEQAGRSERARALRLGGQLGVDLFFRVTRGTWLFVAGEGTLLRPPVVITVAGRSVGQEPRGAFRALLGVRKAW